MNDTYKAFAQLLRLCWIDMGDAYSYTAEILHHFEYMTNNQDHRRSHITPLARNWLHCDSLPLVKANYSYT